MVLPPPSGFPSPEQIKAVKTYIKQTWITLSRSPADILAAAGDPKIDRTGSPSLVYISAKEERSQVEKSLRQVISTEEFNSIEIRMLPAEVSAIQEHGLLYLPHPYVVPGGRFNEMYGWDIAVISLVQYN